jgi:hypothetical protein
MTFEAIREIEMELARDQADLEQAIQKRKKLSADSTPGGYHAVAIGISLRSEIQSLSNRLFKGRFRLMNARR